MTLNTLPSLPPSLLPSPRAKAVLVTDKRVKVMNEVIAGIKAIKMYAWENAFQLLITRIRRQVIINPQITLAYQHCIPTQSDIDQHSWP